MPNFKTRTASIEIPQCVHGEPMWFRYSIRWGDTETSGQADTVTLLNSLVEIAEKAFDDGPSNLTVEIEALPF